ncbi:MAG: hypothetical protein WBG57_08605, partial [Ornithinimicrobium sp.]
MTGRVGTAAHALPGGGVLSGHGLLSGRVPALIALTVLTTWFAVPLVPVALWAFADRWTFPALLPQDWGLRGWREAQQAGVPAAFARST